MDYEPKQHRRRQGWSRFNFFRSSPKGSSAQSSQANEPRTNESQTNEPEEVAQEELLPLAETSDSFLLSEAQVGDRVWIVGLTAGEGLLERLLGMGLNRGTEIEVVHRAGGGPLMVAVANTRLGLGAGMAEKILVRRSGLSPYQSANAVRQVSHQSANQEVQVFRDSREQKAQGQKAQNQTHNQTLEETPMQIQRHLRDLAVGSQGRVTGYDQGSASYRQKLLAMGLTPGTEFTITRQAPLGDPVELRVRGFQLSLRKAEADALIVEAVDHD